MPPPVPPDDDAGSSAATFALALRRVEGVGRVTARRLVRHFSDYDDLRAHPREQVLLRIKGVANAEAITQRLFDEAVMADALERAQAQTEALAERGVRLLSTRSAAWPAGLDALPDGRSPLLLWTYGAPEVLTRPSAAFLARPPMDEAPFEHAQALAARLLACGGVPILAAQSGFDVALARRAAAEDVPVALVAACGLAKVPREVRPAVSQAVRAGGVLLSPFPMTHGPFDHDQRERALVQAALARAAVAAPAKADSPERRALAWAAEAGRPAFLLGASAPEPALPDAIQPVRSEDDFAAVMNAALAGA